MQPKIEKTLISLSVDYSNIQKSHPTPPPLHHMPPMKSTYEFKNVSLIHIRWIWHPAETRRFTSLFLGNTWLLCWNPDQAVQIEPWPGHNIVFLGKTHYFHGTSFFQGI